MGVRRDEDEGEHARVSALPSSTRRELVSDPRDGVLVPSSWTPSPPSYFEPTRGVVKRKAWSAIAVFCLGISARVRTRRRYTSAAATATAGTAEAIAPARAGVDKPCLWDGLGAVGAGSGDEGPLPVAVDGDCWLVLGAFVQTGEVVGEPSTGMSYVEVELDVDVVVGNGISGPGPSIIAVSVLDQPGSSDTSWISEVVTAPNVLPSGLVDVVGNKFIEQSPKPLVMHSECVGSRMVCAGSRVWWLAAMQGYFVLYSLSH